MKIAKLSENLIKKIAAGEVISHPANALKEMIENAIDAQSTHITIHTNNNGLDKIVVIDDGLGMELDDLKICTQLHTTSKTKEEDHMFGTHSLGFRGEALASIDAISDLTIETNGYKLEKNTITHSNITSGTKIEISNLFANLPARLKFLKSSSVEWNLLKQVIQKYAINFENITWSVFNNNKKYAHYEKTTKDERLKQIFKDDFVQQTHAFDNIDFNLYLFKTHKNQNHLFVNNRPIKDNAITNYIRSIFKEFFMKHENPSYVLFIDIDPFLIDCNVHPAKEEIKFISYSNIFGALSYIFSPTLLKKFYSPNEAHGLNFVYDVANITTYENVPYVREEHTNTSSPNYTFQYEMPMSNAHTTTLMQHEIIETKAQHKIIGQIKNSFIIFETEDGIGIFDQHAAHEREIYEQMKQKLKKEDAQKLLVPIELNLGVEEKEYIKENTQKFENKGIIFDANCNITHIPHILSEQNFGATFEQYCDSSTDCEIMIDRMLADIACKNALKANTALSPYQCSQLLETALKNVPICNHGRPVFKYFKLSEIANWFKR